MKELLKKNKFTVVLLIILVLVGIFFLLIDFITDWMWFAEMGYVDVFLKQLVTELKVGIPAFIIITFLMRLYLGHIKNNYFKKVKSHEITNLSRLSKITTVIAIIFGALASIFTVQELWFKMLQFANASGFNVNDPLYDFIVSSCLLPLGSLAFVLFCTSKKGWGFKNFMEEANTGVGLKIKPWMKGYMTYILPLIIFVVFALGILTTFGIISL